MVAKEAVFLVSMATVGRSLPPTRTEYVKGTTSIL